MAAVDGDGLGVISADAEWIWSADPGRTKTSTAACMVRCNAGGSTDGVEIEFYFASVISCTRLATGISAMLAPRLHHREGLRHGCCEGDSDVVYSGGRRGPGPRAVGILELAAVCTGQFYQTISTSSHRPSSTVRLPQCIPGADIVNVNGL